MAHINPPLPSPHDPTDANTWGGDLNSAVQAAIDQINAHDDLLAAGVSGTVAVNDTAVTVANTTTETVIGTVVLPANTFSTAGIARRLLAYGRISSPAPGAALTIRVKAGSTALASYALPAQGVSAVNLPFRFDAEISVRTTGASGSVLTYLSINAFPGTVSLADNGNGTGTLTTTTPARMSDEEVGSLDTTASQTITMTVQWATASASNTLTKDVFRVETS